MGKQGLTACLSLSFATGCAESEVYRLFCAGLSGLSLGKDGENRIRPVGARGFLETPCSLCASLLSALHPCVSQSLTVVFREPFPVQPKDSESPPAQLVSTYHHLESVINTACFTLWTRLL